MHLPLSEAEPEEASSVVHTAVVPEPAVHTPAEVPADTDEADCTVPAEHNRPVVQAQEESGEPELPFR